MNTKQRTIAICFLAMSLLDTGCGPGQLLGPTLTPTPTPTLMPTPMPTSTNTPTPTSTPTVTPSPTPTLTPTPGLGVAVVGGQWEITIIEAVTTDLWLNYSPKSGYAMLVLDMSFRNLDPDKGTTVAMKKMAVTAADESSWIPVGFQFSDEPDEMCVETNDGKQNCIPGDMIAGFTGIQAIFVVQDLMGGRFLFPIQKDLLSASLTFEFQEVRIPFEVK